MVKALNRVRAHALYGFPRPLLPARTATERWRHTSLQERYRLLAAPLRAALYGVAVFGYPLAVAEATLSTCRRLRLQNEGGGLAEALRMYALALLRNVPPVEYALYNFQDAARRASSGDYLYWTDTPALQRLNRLRGAANEDVQDKARFAALCQEAHLPHVAILAEIKEGRQVSGMPLDALPGPELWVKPTAGSAAAGASRWSVEGQETYRSGAEVLSREKWEARLLTIDCIVQERITNHPGLRAISNGAAVVLRLTTVADRAGAVTLIGAGAGLPYGSQESTTGGVACTLSLDSGSIVSALGHRNQPLPEHPDTGQPLHGFVIPLWQQCCALVLRAHREAFARFATLGWDVVITPEGPLLLEANSGWNPIGLQYHFGPVGRSAIGAIIADELELAR